MFNYNNNLAFEQFLFAVYVTIVTIGYINTLHIKSATKYIQLRKRSTSNFSRVSFRLQTQYV